MVPLSSKDNPEAHECGKVVGRSWLFVPGNRPDRFAKAVASGADVVVLDLEDAVGADDKADARDRVRAWLNNDGEAAVRVNPASSPHHEADLAALRGTAGLRAVLVPMAETPCSLVRVHDQLGVPVVAQIETAIGLHHAVDLAAARGTTQLAFGHLDLAADLAAEPDSDIVAWARSALVMASRIAGLGGPLDSVTTNLDDDDATRADSDRARRSGFTGKLCIHPGQVPVVNQTLAPNPADIVWATRVVEAADGAVRIEGEMVDAPVVRRARRILEQAGGGQ